MSLPFIVNKIVHTTKNAYIKDFGKLSGFAGNKGYRGACKRRPNIQKVLSSACTCIAHGFLDGDDMRVNGDFIQHRTLRLLRSNDRDENIE